MLELCFDMSTRGALRVAQHCGRGGKGAVGVIVAASDQGDPAVAEQEARRAAEAFRRHQEELEREAIPLGGDPGDVMTLSLGLDMGDIREPLGEVRHQLLKQWYDWDEVADRDWGRCLEAAEHLKAVGPGDTVRIWVDRTPASACGLLHAASLLKDTKAAVHVVALPPWRERPDGVVETYLGWGEVEPERFGHFLSREEPVPPLALGAMAHRWEVLQKENAPLRASAAWGRTFTTISSAGTSRRARRRSPPSLAMFWDRSGRASVMSGWRSASAGCSPRGSCGWSGRIGRCSTAPLWKGLDISREICKIEHRYGSAAGRTTGVCLLHP